MSPKLSFVLPVFNEDQTIPSLGNIFEMTI
jgi:glycosyltransferase involved in cell wall biosynthesis